MGELLNAYPVSGIKRRSIAITERTLMGMETGYEYKEFIAGKLGKKDISLILRDESPIYVKNWQDFQKVGLPVVPTLRLDTEGNILVSDIKADGSEVYGKGLNSNLMLSPERRFRPRPQCDEEFLKITESNSFDDVKQEVRNLVATANNNCILLPYDDPCELIVHPKGSWKLMILDLRFGYAYNSSSINKEDMIKIRRSNVEATWTFLLQLQSLREQLLPSEELEKKKNWSFFKKY